MISRTWDDQLFTYRVDATADGNAVLVTVRRADTGEERSKTVSAAELADGEYRAVINSHVSRLRDSLGYVRPAPYPASEFLVYHYCCRDREGLTEIEHAPTGRRVRAANSTRREVSNARQKLERELREAGVEPQPRDASCRPYTRKLGKPRHRERVTPTGAQEAGT